jgi:hypothetical protein
MKRPSIALIKQLFSYNPLTGTIYRVEGRADRLGLIGHTEEVSVKGTRVMKSHLAWALHHGYWPSELIDHRDGDHQNTRIDNLREATHTQNQHNKVGFGKYPKGVVYKGEVDRKKPWTARIRVNGKKKSLGAFATMEEAAAAYVNAANKVQGDFALHNS